MPRISLHDGCAQPDSFGPRAGNRQDANPLPKVELAAFREGLRGLRLAETLVPLTGKEYALSSLGELKVNGRPAVGIKAKKKGAADLDLWFDKKTRLPVKAEMRVTDSTEEAAWTGVSARRKRITAALLVSQDRGPLTASSRTRRPSGPLTPRVIQRWMAP